MSAPAPLSKLAELHGKKDLVSTMSNALEIAFLLASTNAKGDSALRLHARAREIYADTAALLANVEDVAERQRLEVRLKDLRESLETRRLEKRLRPLTLHPRTARWRRGACS